MSPGDHVIIKKLGGSEQLCTFEKITVKVIIWPHLQIAHSYRECLSGYFFLTEKKKKVFHERIDQCFGEVIRLVYRQQQEKRKHL